MSQHDLKQAPHYCCRKCLEGVPRLQISWCKNAACECHTAKAALSDIDGK